MKPSAGIFNSLPPGLSFELPAFTISELRSNSVACETREGRYQGRLTTIELSGKAPPCLAGAIVLFTVKDDTQTVRIRRKVGVTSDGGYGTSIAAYSLPLGCYSFVFYTPENDGTVISSGSFVICSATSVH